MNNEEYLKWIMPSIKNRSLVLSNFRYKKAEDQATMETVKPTDIINFVNEFLRKVGMKTTEDLSFSPRIELQRNGIRQIKYAEIRKKNQLDDIRDIVWIKFTKDNYISVIGTGCDISFSEWAKNNTTAGHINRHLNKEWDDSFVLIFPLKEIPENLNRSDIESGIGNYLIHKGVPILDFYSHNY